MRCDEILKVLNEYVDGTMDPALCAELEQHMADCNPCQVVVDNIRQTISIYRGGIPWELPPEFQARLHACLRERWRKKQQQA